MLQSTDHAQIKQRHKVTVRFSHRKSNREAFHNWWILEPVWQPVSGNLAVGAAGSGGERVGGRSGNSGEQTRGGGGTFALFCVCSRGASLVTYSHYQAGVGSPPVSPGSQEKFAFWAFAADITGGLSRSSSAIERDAQQFCGGLIRSRGTEPEAPSSELDEPAAAATCNGSQCLAVAGRPYRWHVSCEKAC